jgi:hypothetical protein
MKLYDVDYTKPYGKVKKALEEHHEFWNQGSIDFSRCSDPIAKYDDEIRRFVFHYKTKYPNNVIWHYHRDKEWVLKETKLLRNVIKCAEREKDVQDYIKNNKKWFIPASILKEYNFGHKENYLFPEMKIGSSMQVDYAILGRNSDGFSLILVEFESPDTSLVLHDGYKLSKSASTGMGQINSWKEWMDDNRLFFLKEHGFIEHGINIPNTRIHYCLVISKRSKMKSIDRERKSRIISEARNLNIINYDRLCDYVSQITEGFSWYCADGSEIIE